MQVPKGRDQVSGGVSVPCRHATPVADALCKPISCKISDSVKMSSSVKMSQTGIMSISKHNKIPTGMTLTEELKYNARKTQFQS